MVRQPFLRIIRPVDEPDRVWADVADEVLGRPAYDSLSEVEEEVDIVDVFRPSAEVEDIVDEVLSREDADVVWLQLGVHDDDAVARAGESGRKVVQDRCMKPEHQRLLGSV